jgi:hypothetical protein
MKERTIPLDGLDDDERGLLEDLTSFEQTHQDWNEFSNYWMARVAEFYAARGLTRPQIRQTAVWRVAQDLDGRLAVRLGHARMPDYRDEIAQLIRERFRTRREFCQATGLSEDLLSHVLNRRKHLAIDTLVEALARIGYRLRITPLEERVA